MITSLIFMSLSMALCLIAAANSLSTSIVIFTFSLVIMRVYRNAVYLSSLFNKINKNNFAAFLRPKAETPKKPLIPNNKGVNNEQHNNKSNNKNNTNTNNNTNNNL